MAENLSFVDTNFQYLSSNYGQILLAWWSLDLPILL